MANWNFKTTIQGEQVVAVATHPNGYNVRAVGKDVSEALANLKIEIAAVKMKIGSLQTGTIDDSTL